MGSAVSSSLVVLLSPERRVVGRDGRYFPRQLKRLQGVIDKQAEDAGKLHAAMAT